MHVGLRGDPKLAVLTSYELWKMQREENPGSEAEFWALFNYGNHCLTNKLHDEAVPAITEARELALKLGKPELAANCSRALATALLQVGRLEDSLNLTREAIEDVFRTLATESSADRRHNPGLEEARADVIVGGLCILVKVMRYFRFDDCLVSEADILDGLAASIS